MAVAVLMLTEITTGPIELSLRQVVSTLLWPAAAETSHRTVVWTLRTPVALMAVLVGASLGTAGAAMQTILNNPLASPYTLGVSAAASFGAALSMVYGATVVPLAMTVMLPASAFVWTLLCTTAILLVARYKGGAVESIVLSGVALLFLFNSGVAFMQYLASEDTLHAIVFWIFGSLQSATWDKIGIVAMVLTICLPLLVLQSWKLMALRMGEEHASSLGVNVLRLRLFVLAIVSVLTATAVCFAGAIGFIGLVAPHLARMAIGEDQRYFLPMSTLLGAALLSIASTASKSLIPGAILPLGIVTALFGVPFFLTMVLVQKRSYW